MKAGVIGAVVLGGAVIGALAWTHFSRQTPEPPATAGAVEGAPDVRAESPAAGSGEAASRPAAREAARPTAAASALAPAEPATQTSDQERLAAVAPQAADPAPAPPSSAAEEPHPHTPAPTFDVVRVDGEGQTVIAGRSAPNERIEVLLDGQVVDTLLADAGGKFVGVLAAGPLAAARELRLRVVLPKPPQATEDGTPAAPAGAMSDAPSAVTSGGPAGPVSSSVAAPASGASLSRPTLAPERREGAEAARAASGASPGLAADASASPAGPPDTSLESSPAADAVSRPARSAPAAAAGAPATAPPPGSADAGRLAPVAPAGTSEHRYVLSDPVIILPPAGGGDAPALVEPRGDELALLQPGGPEASGVVLDQLTRQPSGDLLLRGRARPGHAVRIYGNDRPIDTVAVADGGWSLTLPAARARDLRLFRLDEIARSGAVTSRVEVPFEPSDAAAQIVRDRRVTVRRGDNLWRIAEQHYGEGIRYSLIFGANSDLIRDPDLIYPDQVFTVPELVEAE